MPPGSGRRHRGFFAAAADRMETNAVRETRTRIVCMPPGLVKRHRGIFGAVVDSVALSWSARPPPWLVRRERGSFACHPGSCDAVVEFLAPTWILRRRRGFCGAVVECDAANVASVARARIVGIPPGLVWRRCSASKKQRGSG